MQRSSLLFLSALILVAGFQPPSIFAGEHQPKVHPRRTLPASPLHHPTPRRVFKALEHAVPPGDVVIMGLPSAGELRHRYELTIKFKDGVQARANAEGKLISSADPPADLSAAQDIADRFGLGFAPAIVLASERSFSDLEQDAERRSGIGQPDLAGILRVERRGADNEFVDVSVLKRVGEKIQQVEVVEFATLRSLEIPPPQAAPTPTPDFLSQQSYHGSNPGMAVDAAVKRGLLGAGIGLSDCEYAWRTTHEDLSGVTITVEAGQTLLTEDENGIEHATAVLGMLAAPDNGFGITGLIPAADFRFFPEEVKPKGSKDVIYRRLSSISSAIANSNPGDVVLLEMQEYGVGGNFSDGRFVPAEVDQDVWLVVRNGVDNGVVVVAAAGNGDQNLDNAKYHYYKRLGDSGAIIVGAGSSDAAHDKLNFSTYGTRVDVQGWGENVFTLGYGEFAEYDGKKDRRYTDEFGGTSSASPMAAAAAVLLQEHAVNLTGAPFSPKRVRKILRRTGIEQGDHTADDPIGRFINVEYALLNAEVLNDDFEYRAELSGSAGQVTANNKHAWDEPSEDQHATGHSVWWKWTAPDGGELELDTTGTNFDVTVAVYKGEGEAFALTQSAFISRDQFENIVVSSHLRQNVVTVTRSGERFIFPVRSGLEYQIKVDGKDSNHFGDIALRWAFTPGL